MTEKEARKIFKEELETFFKKVWADVRKIDWRCF